MLVFLKFYCHTIFLIFASFKTPWICFFLNLGVFAPSSDEEENASFMKFSSVGGKKKASYNTPVNFISGGVKKGNKIELADVSFILILK